MPERMQMMSPTPKPERSEAAAPEACSRSRRFPASARKTSPTVMTSVPAISATPCRVPSWSGCRIASGRRDPKEEVMPRITAKPSASPTRAIPWPNKTAANAPGESKEGNLGQHRAGSLLKHAAEMRNRGQRDDPGKNQQSRDSINQPDVFPTPGGEPLHGGGEAAVEHASHQNQHEAPANLMTHNSSRGIPVRAVREPPRGKLSPWQPATPRGGSLPQRGLANQDDSLRAGAVRTLIRRI